MSCSSLSLSSSAAGSRAFSSASANASAPANIQNSKGASALSALAPDCKNPPADLPLERNAEREPKAQRDKEGPNQPLDSSTSASASLIPTHLNEGFHSMPKSSSYSSCTTQEENEEDLNFASSTSSNELSPQIAPPPLSPDVTNQIALLRLSSSPQLTKAEPVSIHPLLTHPSVNPRKLPSQPLDLSATCKSDFLLAVMAKRANRFGRSLSDQFNWSILEFYTNNEYICRYFPDRPNYVWELTHREKIGIIGAKIRKWILNCDHLISDLMKQTNEFSEILLIIEMAPDYSEQKLARLALFATAFDQAEDNMSKKALIQEWDIQAPKCGILDTDLPLLLHHYLSFGDLKVVLFILNSIGFQTLPREILEKCVFESLMYPLNLPPLPKDPRPRNHFSHVQLENCDPMMASLLNFATKFQLLTSDQLGQIYLAALKNEKWVVMSSLLSSIRFQDLPRELLQKCVFESLMHSLKPLESPEDNEGSHLTLANCDSILIPLCRLEEKFQLLNSHQRELLQKGLFKSLMYFPALAPLPEKHPAYNNTLKNSHRMMRSLLNMEEKFQLLTADQLRQIDLATLKHKKWDPDIKFWIKDMLDYRFPNVSLKREGTEEPPEQKLDTNLKLDQPD